MIKFIQESEDSEGNPPSMPPGTKVLFLPENLEGVVQHQKLHYDGFESFFGNVIVKMVNGEFYEGHCWQFKKLEEVK